MSDADCLQEYDIHRSSSQGASLETRSPALSEAMPEVIQASDIRQQDLYAVVIRTLHRECCRSRCASSPKFRSASPVAEGQPPRISQLHPTCSFHSCSTLLNDETKATYVYLDFILYVFKRFYNSTCARARKQSWLRCAAACGGRQWLLRMISGCRPRSRSSQQDLPHAEKGGSHPRTISMNALTTGLIYAYQI